MGEHKGCLIRIDVTEIPDGPVPLVNSPGARNKKGPR